MVRVRLTLFFRFAFVCRPRSRCARSLRFSFGVQKMPRNYHTSVTKLPGRCTREKANSFEKSRRFSSRASETSPEFCHTLTISEKWDKINPLENLRGFCAHKRGAFTNRCDKIPPTTGLPRNCVEWEDWPICPTPVAPSGSGADDGSPVTFQISRQPENSAPCGLATGRFILRGFQPSQIGWSATALHVQWRKWVCR
jgi:hypothetical protein